MAYYKGTKQECEKYNLFVIEKENYSGETTNWASIQEIDGTFYILKHPNYDADYLIEVEFIPPMPPEETY
jgi:hypothetical protein